MANLRGGDRGVEGQTEGNWERLPLREAYKLGLENGLGDEVSNIRNMDIEWDLSYTSSLRRGYIIELFKLHGLWERFLDDHWPNGRTRLGQSLIRRSLGIKQRYEDFLASGGKSAPPEEEEEEAEPDQGFAYEAHLRDFLAKHPNVIEPGLTLYEDARGKGVEYPIAEGGRIDLLAKDRSNRFVVIELKVSRGRNRTLGQLLYYMGWVDTNLAREQKSRGIVISREISDDLKTACQRVSEVSLHTYDLNVTTKKVYPV
jgi:hypothetical protein